MNPETATRSTDNAYCLSCGYPLRELPTPRCPECGRPFDPADPRTMSLGHPLRVWQRWLLRPTGWRVISLAVLGTAGLVYLTRYVQDARLICHSDRIAARTGCRPKTKQSVRKTCCRRLLAVRNGVGPRWVADPGSRSIQLCMRDN